MSRSRFSWDHVSDELVLVLSGERSAGVGRQALADRFGAQPETSFVRDLWQTLLGQWLPIDDAARESIVEALRTQKLGVMSIGADDRAGQLEYLASCRNAPTLRAAVLKEFLSRHSSGSITEPTPEEAKEGAAVGSSAELRDWILACLSERYGAEFQPDADGDIPIGQGSSVTFVRPNPDLPIVHFFAPLVQGMRPGSDVYAAVNELNRQTPFTWAEVSEDGTAIVLHAALPALDLSPQSLFLILDCMLEDGDFFDTILTDRFGGSTLMEDAVEELDV